MTKSAKPDSKSPGSTPAPTALGAECVFAVDYGEGPGRITAGTKATLSGVYPPGTPGIGSNGVDDTVVVRIVRRDSSAREVALSRPTFDRVCGTQED